MKRIGFIGLGYMGKGMAANISRANDMIVYDISSQTITNFIKNIKTNSLIRNISYSLSIKCLANEVDIICLSLPHEKACEEVICGSNGILSSTNWRHTDNTKQKIIVDHGTFSRTFALNISRKVEEITNGCVSYVDAPVSGGPQGAQDGTLTIMAGGTPDAIETVNDILHSVGKKVIHFGPVGSGMAAKLVNQALVTCHAQAAAEALFMSEQLGLTQSIDDVERLADMLSSSWGQSKVFDLVVKDYMAALVIGKGDKLHDLPTQAPLRNLNKDMSCVFSDLRAVVPPDSADDAFPLFSETQKRLDTACSPGFKDNGMEQSISNSPFVALMQPLRESIKKLD